MTLLLKYWKPLAALLLVAALFGLGWVKGAAQVRAEWRAEQAAAALAAANQAQQQAQATVVEVVRYVDRLKVVQGKTQTIIKEVPKYVTLQADADCSINIGFVRLHDHAAANTLPDPAGAADAAPSGVALSAVAAAVAENYGSCHENSAQLTALQGWVKAMAEADK